MAVTERAESRSGDGKSLVRSYIITDAADESGARAALLAAAPAAVGSLALDASACDVEQVEGHLDLWLGNARYSRPEGQRKATGSATFQFDTGGETVHVTHSLQTQSSHALVAPPTNYKGAIGVTDEGVEGVDLVGAKFEFAITLRLSAASMTQAYVANLYASTGRINAAAWSCLVDAVPFSFAKGEVLFLGVSGSKRESEADWELVFRFAASPTRTNLPVGDMIIPAKEGFSYLWIRYGPKEDAAAKRIAMVPIEAYVERVYEYADFTLLGIPAP